eukprot:1217820-Pleurochrysis_carterae.AAC.1
MKRRKACCPSCTNGISEGGQLVVCLGHGSGVGFRRHSLLHHIAVGCCSCTSVTAELFGKVRS